MFIWGIINGNIKLGLFMNKQEIWIVAITTVLIITTFAAVAFLSSGYSPIKEKSTQKRFSAAPGKTREKPLLLVSKKREDTFGNTDEEEQKGDTAEINKIYSAQLGKDDDKNGTNAVEGAIEGSESEKKPVEADISKDLEQLLQSIPGNQQTPESNVEEPLNKLMDNLSSQEKKLEVLKNHLDSLMSKGLTEWVTKKLEEITGQNTENKSVLSEAQWLLAQIKNTQGDTATAEQYFQQAWQNISSSSDLSDPKQEELFRLLGLNYVQFLRKQNKNTEAETISNTVSEKLKNKTVSQN